MGQMYDKQIKHLPDSKSNNSIFRDSEINCLFLRKRINNSSFDVYSVLNIKCARCGCEVKFFANLTPRELESAINFIGYTILVLC